MSEDFAGIYDRCFPKVYNYVRCRVKSPEAADDITAKVFEKALKNLGDYDAARAPCEAWIFGIARNSVGDWFRDEARRRETSLEEAPEPAELSSPETGRENLRLLEAVSGLDERSRDILALKFYSEMTNREIAALTGLGESNVAVIIFRAVKKLQADFKL